MANFSAQRLDKASPQVALRYVRLQITKLNKRDHKSCLDKDTRLLRVVEAISKLETTEQKIAAGRIAYSSCDNGSPVEEAVMRALRPLTAELIIKPGTSSSTYATLGFASA